MCNLDARALWFALCDIATERNPRGFSGNCIMAEVLALETRDIGIIHGADFEKH